MFNIYKAWDSITAQHETRDERLGWVEQAIADGNYVAVQYRSGQARLHSFNVVDL